ncbi:MAG TPA: hypothetical protein VKL61_03530 [Candidatus Polarisedimenticolia bacterium]|nr:hypothetical protein [Candidatus Polarisedimenticolia bacterium]
MAFDPKVEAIRSALRAVDKDSRAVQPYLNLIDAYEKCADQEDEPELLEQAGFVVRDVKLLPMTEDQKQLLRDLESRVARTLERIRSGAKKA